MTALRTSTRPDKALTELSVDVILPRSLPISTRNGVRTMMSKAKRFAFAGIAGLLLSLLAPLGAQATEGHPGPLVQEEVGTAGPTSVAKTHSNELAARSIAERLLASDDPAAYFASLRPTEQSIIKAYVMVDHTVTNFEYRPANAAANASAEKGIVPNRAYSPQAAGHRLLGRGIHRRRPKCVRCRNVEGAVERWMVRIRFRGLLGMAGRILGTDVRARLDP